MTDRETVETTFADLRPGDLVIDKAGNAWPIADLEPITDMVIGPRVDFWLCDPVTKVKMHLMKKAIDDAVTVSRVPSHADEAAKLKADFPESDVAIAEQMLSAGNEAQELVEEVLGGEVEVEYTSREYDAANAATDDAPVDLPAFTYMTPLEQRTHLYLLHGVFATDVRSRDELLKMHVDAHRMHDSGELKSKHVPHTHDGGF